MGIIQEFRARKKEKEMKQRALEDEDRIINDIRRRKLSHNEREMIAVLKAEKEKYLKEALRLEEIRRKHDELFRERKMMMGSFNLMQ